MPTCYSIKDCFQQKVPLHTMITLQGWVKTRRDAHAGLCFIALHDGSCFSTMQIVATDDLPHYQDDVSKITPGTAIRITGTLVPSQGKGQTLEVQATHIEIVGRVEHPERYPIQAKRHTLEFLREVAHLRPRTNTIGAITRVRNCLSFAIHQFFQAQGFQWIHTPIITASDCEGAGELFRVSTLDLMNLPKTAEGQIDYHQDFFGRETFLTVSGQLNVEAYCLALSKVYTFGPTFRAENSNTSRHLAEFWMVEPEIAFAGLSELCAMSQSFLKTLCQKVLEECADDMAFFNQFIDPSCLSRVESLAQANFEQVTYTEAIAALEKASVTFEFPVRWGIDLQSEHERYLAEQYYQKPVILTDYPKTIKSFYMRLNDDQQTVAAMDVLVPGIGEIIGGSQREERLPVLDARMAEAQLNPEPYQWYRDLRQYGSVPHAGFGLGLERLISYITGVTNVRDVIPFPRTPGNAKF